MSNMSHLNSAVCCIPLERVRYFPRQLLTADDLTAEQDYYREKMRRHNRYLHGWGVVCGCEVERMSGGDGLQVQVAPGFAISPAGDEIHICEPVNVDLQLGAQDQPCTVKAPCPALGEMPPAPADSRTLYIAVRYAECYSRPVRVHPAGCGCDEIACEYSRVRETFEMKILWQLPDSHRRAAQEDARWCNRLRAASDALRKQASFPAPACPECSDDPWVVLASLAMPDGRNQKQTGSTEAGAGPQISYDDRRVLLSVQRLQTALLCVGT